MEFRRLACTAAAAARPLASLCSSKTLRQFSISAVRAADDRRANNASLLDLSDSLMAGVFDPKTRPNSPNIQSDYSNSMPAPSSMASENIKMPKMGPTAGRSVVVQSDVAQAFMKLRSVVRQNNVRTDFQTQRFHERPGLKRKRLASKRHRQRFKDGFRRMIAVVMDMKKKGM